MFGGLSLETLYRWSKFVEEDRLEEWETRLILAEVVYMAEKQVGRKRWQLSSYTTTRDLADALRSRFGGVVTEVRPGDWQPSAELGSEARLKIRDTFIVTEAGDDSVWESLKLEHPDRIVLSFPPQMAFGTGGHPTTAGCLRFLVDAARMRLDAPWSFLDLGCGSGILAVAAAALGAERVVAVEIDDMALDYARRNAHRHGVAERIEFVLEDVVEYLEKDEAGPFDIVAANLFSELLIRTLPVFGARMTENGEAIISGFLTSQARSVSDAASASGIPLTEFLRRGKWVAARGCHRNQ